MYIQNKNIIDSIKALIIFWTIFAVFSQYIRTPLISILLTSFCGLVAFIYILTKNKINNILTYKTIFLALLIFIFKIIVGILHYIYTIDEFYFEKIDPIYNYLFDYEWLNNAMILISNGWKEDGILSPVFLIVIDNKNSFLLPYFSLLYYLGNNEFHLNITIVNTLHSSLVAVVLASFSNNYVKKEDIQKIFLIIMIQPFGLFTSIMWRDSVGQYFLIIGAILILQYNGKINQIIKLITGIFLLMFLRTIYFISGIILLVFTFNNDNKNKLKYSSPIFLLFIIPLYGIIEWIVKFYNFEVFSSITSDVLNLPKKIILSLVGPFPWTQILDKNIPGHEYILASIFMANYNIVILISFIKDFINKSYNQNIYSNKIILFVLIISMMGIFTYGHVSYVTVSSIFLITLLSRVQLNNFYYKFFIATGINFSAGLLWYLI
jgi:hypothetical protein